MNKIIEMLAILLLLASGIKAQALNGYDSNGNRVNIGVDAVTRSLMVVEYEHHEIHDGRFFRAGYVEDLANGDTAIVVLFTPDSERWTHIRPAVDGEGEFEVKLFENPTSVTGGTEITPKNANRNSTNTSVDSLIHSPTAINVSGATQLSGLILGSGRSTGGNESALYEWILKQNETYIFMVINKTATTNQVNIRLQWYEHISKG